MPVSFIPLYATIALALSAVLSAPFFTSPALAEPDNALRLGFLESVDDPSQLYIDAAKTGAPVQHSDIQAEVDTALGTWKRGLGPVWVWNPPGEQPDISVVASR